MIGSVSGVVVGVLLLLQISILVLWYRPGRNSFAWRLDRLLSLLLVENETAERRRTRWSACRWRTQLRPLYAQGYQAAAEAIAPPGPAARGSDLVQETLAALHAGRRDGGAELQAREDPIVVFAYGIGAWPPSADLTSLERLLAEIGVSQPALRTRFDSLLRLVGTPQRTREFRELAGASFVLGAAARILEAALASNAVPPRGLLATVKAHLR